MLDTIRPSSTRKRRFPAWLESWFTAQSWKIRPHQLAMLDAFVRRESTLLIAPTGYGKTLAGFLPSIASIHEAKTKGLHTVYVSPLKALTNDIERNLIRPIRDMGLDVTVETRTGDTPSHKRARQRKNPPNILLTTPESLMLMLSYPDAKEIFGSLQCVIIDELHSFAHNKRGDFTALALARLEYLAPKHIRFGLSATVAQPEALAGWLGIADAPARIHQVQETKHPDIRLLETEATLPYAGFMAKYAIPEIYKAITEAGTSIVFVNTRAQAELLFQFLWEANSQNLPIGIYHGSLSKEQRRKTEAMMSAGKLRSVVATSALELGIDWGDVDLVVQVGAPKGVSRLLQRIGRSNHRMEEASKAILVPSNRFEVLECRAAIQAIARGMLDGAPLLPGSQDVVVQYIINCACSEPTKAQDIYQQVISAPAYAYLSRHAFERLFAFAVNGGYVLQNYDRFKRLELTEEGDAYVIASKQAALRHRQNIGTIVEAARLKVKRLNKSGRGPTIGEVEESFAQQLTPGDTFFFAGQVLEFIGVRDMFLECRASPAKDPKIPTYAGGQMPLSTYLADGVREVVHEPRLWTELPDEVQEWLHLQQDYSLLPRPDHLLVEHFPRQKRFHTLVYTFEGRKVNQTLGMLITRRMERMGLRPISFSVTDYALSLVGMRTVSEDQAAMLLSPEILADELEEWIVESPMLKRSFRHVAMITGLTEKRIQGERKTMKQVTFSTDLIYDVLRRHEPNHLLLSVTRADAERELLDISRLAHLLTRYEGKMIFQPLKRASPLAIPIIVDVRREAVHGEGTEDLLAALNTHEEAERMMEDVRDTLA
ncbi:MAG: ligase-associated DNA damage response DEXH box helicase [Alphaproteobacteria bacterium]|nr:ligase-associated DNA damage response DEXH box helicase [Alphaproteobacteria bacterium]